MPFFKIILITGLLTILTSCQKNQEQTPLDSAFLRNPEAIIGGTSATSQEFPFMINIWMNSPQDQYNAHHCGGSLIHKKWVLTAAHCVLEEATETTQRPVNATTLTLFIGSDHISGSGGKALKVKRILPHPEFSWPHNDVALIELQKEVNDVQPVPLNDQYLGDSPSAITATEIGWGLIDQEGQVDAEFLQKTSVPLISRSICSQDEFPRQRGWTVGKDTLCAETQKNQRGSCSGDSGGPLLLKTQDGYKQIGIVSWGTACLGKSNRWNSNVEGHADVSHALKWIRTVIR